MLAVSNGFVVKRLKEGGYDLFTRSEFAGTANRAFFTTNLNLAKVYTDRRQAVHMLNKAGRGEFCLEHTSVGAPIDGLEVVPCTLTRAISER